MNIKYSALVLEQIPKLCSAYADFYRTDSGKDMTEIHQQNVLSWVINNYANPDFLFLVACSGKKMAGFAMVMPTPSLDGIKTATIEPLWIVPEYRNQGIGEQMVKLLEGWTNKKEIKICLTYEKPEGGIWSRKKHLGFKPYLMIMKREV